MIEGGKIDKLFITTLFAKTFPIFRATDQVRLRIICQWALIQIGVIQ